jgi:hypothetical protein
VLARANVHSVVLASCRACQKPNMGRDAVINERERESVCVCVVSCMANMITFECANPCMVAGLSGVCWGPMVVHAGAEAQLMLQIVERRCCARMLAIYFWLSMALV